MIKQPLIISAITVISLLSSGPVLSAEKDMIYGSQLMTQQERLEYRQKHKNAKTAAEREQIRNEHHAMMQERAKERNVELPEAPPASGMGMGPRDGMKSGGGMGGGNR